MFREVKPTGCWLFTPGTRPERFSKAAEVGADILIIDLKDAVSPTDKPHARHVAVETLSAIVDGPRRALRINGLDTPAGKADLDALLASKANPDFIVLPKADTAGHLLILDRLLGTAGKNARLVGTIESTRGFSHLEEIARATPRLFGLMLGAARRAIEIVGEQTPLMFSHAGA